MKKQSKDEGIERCVMVLKNTIIQSHSHVLTATRIKLQERLHLK